MVSSTRQRLVERRGADPRLSGTTIVQELPIRKRRVAGDFDSLLAFPNAAVIVQHAARAKGGGVSKRVR